MTLPVTHIDVARIRFRVSYWWPTATSVPVPALSLDPPLDALARVVGLSLRGKFPELRERLERGEEAFIKTSSVTSFFAVPAGPEDLTPENLAGWRALAGTDQLEDPVLVGTTLARSSCIVPRAVLLGILRELDLLRERAARDPEIANIPPPPPEPPPPEPPPEPLLFCANPLEGAPNVSDRSGVELSEQLAVDLDALEPTATTEDELADVFVKRQLLLGELEGLGLLSEARLADKRAYLERWHLPTLVGYLDAATALRAYYRDPIREQYGLDWRDPDKLLDGDVSLDWFRKPGPTPEGATPSTWLAFCEQVLFDNAPGEGAGEILSRIGGRWYQIRYRVEARPYPVIYAATELRR